MSTHFRSNDLGEVDHRGGECGRVPDFYSDGDGKVIFSKRISPPQTV